MQKWRPHDRQAWSDADEFFGGHAVFGTKVGLLTLEMQCACGKIARAFMFFCTTEMDRILSFLAPTVSPCGTTLTMTLPTGYTAVFNGVNHVLGDSHILRTAAKCNADDADRATAVKTSLDFLFQTLQAQILLRSAFKKLYYRSFRRSFAPGGSAAKRNQDQLFNTLSFCEGGLDSFDAHQIIS